MALGWPARKADEKAAGFCGALESTAGEPKDPRESQFPSETRSLFSAEKRPPSTSSSRRQEMGVGRCWETARKAGGLDP